MTTSSSSEEKTPEVKCEEGVVPITKLTANYPLIPRDELEVCEQLGAGTFGSVFKGIWRIKSAKEPMVVALKKVFMLEREVDILSQVRHRNIIQFFGVSHANPDFYIVTEYAENGSLFEYLHNAQIDLSFERILKLAKQIAHGVAYLHYEAPTTIIHRDLKSKNVVLGKKTVCKICDFGTSKDLTHSHTAPTWGGTAAWMSPEIINQREGITTATDVWSYGILLWEILSREIPYKGLTDFKIYSITSQDGCQLLLPDTCPAHLSSLLKRCWYKDPKDRIEMREILNDLEDIDVNEEVHSECVHFVKQKEEWHQKIEEQLIKINELELDYERRKEELKKWEQILRRRESSHRNFLHVIDLMNTTDVAEWDADCVCEWVQYMAAGKDISEKVIDKVISRILQHEIRGSRLLQVTERDLENLGIEPAAIRAYIVEKVGELNLLRPVKTTITSSPKSSASPQDDYINFPPLNISADLEARNKQNKSAFTHSIDLVVGMYSRLLKDNESKRKCRFKIFLDSDWDNSSTINDLPSEVDDSAMVIKDVFMSIANLVDNSVLLESVRCVCPPFGYLEWTEVNLDESPRISVTLAVTYTDQIIQPRNTRINVELTDFSQNSRILSAKTVPLRIRPMPTNTSLSRISSTLMNNQSPSDKGNSLQGVWRARRGSIDNMKGSGIVNEIIPISLMTPDIAEVHRRYQQRFARRSTLSSGALRPQKTPKSPLADEANSRNGPFTASHLLKSQQRSTSDASVSVSPPKSTTTRRGPPLTVVVSYKNMAMRQMARKQNGKKDTRQFVQRKFTRLRTTSESENARDDVDASSIDENFYANQPKFYVCEDESPSTSFLNNDELKSKKSFYPQMCSLSDLQVMPAMSRKSSNLENEFPNNRNSIPRCTNAALTSPAAAKNANIQGNGVNAECASGACECRKSRRAPLPDAAGAEGEEAACNSAAEDPLVDVNCDAFIDRKCRPKPSGNRKYKKTNSKLKTSFMGTQQFVDNTTDEFQAKQNIPVSGLKNSLCPGKQNTVSRKVYGGYNKWRWK